MIVDIFYLTLSFFFSALTSTKTSIDAQLLSRSRSKSADRLGKKVKSVLDIHNVFSFLCVHIHVIICIDTEIENIQF